MNPDGVRGQHRRVRTTTVRLASVLSFGCGVSQPAPTAPAPPTDASHRAVVEPRASSSNVDPSEVTDDYVPPKFGAPSAAPAPLPTSVRQPAIVKLAKTAAACPLDEKGALQYDCEALEGWRAEEAAFEGGKGSLTILSLLEDPDPKLRQAAAARSDVLDEAFFADRDHAARYVAIVARETDAPTAKELGRRFGSIRADALGLEAEVFALTDHPLVVLRGQLGWNLALSRPTLSPFELAVMEKLANDADLLVRTNAIRRLGGQSGPEDGRCRLLGRAARRADASGAEAVEVIAKGGCERLIPKLIDTLEAKVSALPAQAPPLPLQAIGNQYGEAAKALCQREPQLDVATRKRVFAVGAALLEKEDCWVRASGLRAIEACDAAAARPLIEPLVNARCIDLKSQAEAALKRITR